jgi:hypothetical protein
MSLLASPGQVASKRPQNRFGRVCAAQLLYSKHLPVASRQIPRHGQLASRAPWASLGVFLGDREQKETPTCSIGQKLVGVTQTFEENECIYESEH